MIELKKAEVTKMVIDCTKHAIETYEATICSDRWTNTNSRLLLNVMLVCLARDVFLGSIDTTGEKKDIAYTTKAIVQYIEEVGPINIVQLYMDNAAVMTGTLKWLQEKYPHLYLQGCAAHVLNLLLEDWAKEATVKLLVTICARIVKYIKKYEYTLALFRRFSPKKALGMPSKTCTAMNYLMIHRLVECRAALLQVVSEAIYREFKNELFTQKNGPTLKFRAQRVEEDIHFESFWVECDN